MKAIDVAVPAVHERIAASAVEDQSCQNFSGGHIVSNRLGLAPADLEITRRQLVLRERRGQGNLGENAQPVEIIDARVVSHSYGLARRHCVPEPAEGEPISSPTLEVVLS